jgi:CBS domain-containing protein
MGTARAGVGSSSRQIGLETEEIAMRVSECMTREVKIANPDQSLRNAAQAMAEVGAGVLPVGDNDRLVGMITDRDIAIRGVAQGRGPDDKVRDVMTAEIRYCFEDEDIGDVLRNMGDIQVRRLPVLDRNKRLVGIISLGDLAADGSRVGTRTAETLTRISEPGGQHTQAAH